jgi:Domain of unknown function (DUF4307)
MSTLAHPYDEGRTAAVTLPTRPTPPEAPVFPPGRYGHRRDPAAQRRRRVVAIVLAAVTVLIGLGIAVKLYQQYAASPYQVSNLTRTNLSDSSFTVRFTVSTPAGQGARCTVVGTSRDGHEVGRAEVDVPPKGPSDTSIDVTYTLATTARADVGDVPGCGPR